MKHSGDLAISGVPMDAARKPGKASRRRLRGPDLADSVARPTVGESRKLFDECFIIPVEAAWLAAGLLKPVQPLRARLEAP